MNSAQLRQARREFVRTRHPDRGGDTTTFAEGLAYFDRQLAGLAEPHERRVTVLHRPRGPSGWLRHLTRLATRPRRPVRVR